MFKIIKFLVIPVLIYVNAAYGAEYLCEISDSGERCHIRELNLTSEDYHVEPVADNLNAIKIVHLEGTVPILTNGVCEVMPNLVRFFAENVSLEEIQANAFQGCDNLYELYLYGNNFVNFDRSAFKGMSNLREIWVSGGNVSSIDLDLSDSKKLTVLALRNMGINVFPAETLREQIHLRDLYLYSNNLFDLDVERILQYTPYLRKINLGDNNFKCSRLREMLDILKLRNVEANSFIRHERERDYYPDDINGIHCLTDEQWESEFAKFSVEQQSFIVEGVTKMDEATTEEISVPNKHEVNVTEYWLDYSEESEDENMEKVEGDDVNSDNQVTLSLEMETLEQKFQEKFDNLGNSLETLHNKIDDQDIQIMKLQNNLINAMKSLERQNDMMSMTLLSLNTFQRTNLKF